MSLVNSISSSYNPVITKFTSFNFDSSVMNDEPMRLNGNPIVNVLRLTLTIFLIDA